MENIIHDIDNIERRLETVEVKTLDDILYTLCGVTMIQIQKSEFSMLGMVSLMKENLLKTDKSFKNLNPTRFLSDLPSDRKYRRQTLGQIIGFLKINLKIFNPDSLDEYLKKRNDFIHNFWNDYLKNKNDKITAIRFVISVLKDSMKWESIFKGFIYIVIKSLEKEFNLESNKHEHLAPYCQSFIDAVLENKE